MANLLLYQHLERGYQAVVIQRDIEEGGKLFQEGTNQIFYFDDFLGTTFLGDRAVVLEENGDRALIEFIDMVRATPTARLILTTREHIYTQAKGKSERLRHAALDDFRVVLRMPNYSLQQKGRILYNHLYFSDLPVEYQDELIRGEFYLRIVKHDKFNPRLVEWLSTFRRVRNVSVGDYQKFVEGLLNDPSEIWRHAYEQEISNAGRSLLLTLFSLEGKAGGLILKQSFNQLHAERARRYGFSTRPEDFRSTLRDLAGAFIKPWSDQGVEVIDPSVLDLLNRVMREVPENGADVIAGSSRFSQIEQVWRFARTENGKPLLSVLKVDAGRLAKTVGTRMLDTRRVNLGKGAVGYRGPTFERRMAVVIEMADAFGASSFRSLLKPPFARLVEEWALEEPHIEDAVALLESLANTSSLSSGEITEMQEKCATVLMNDIRKGCHAHELRSVVDAVDEYFQGDSSILKASKTAFTKFSDGYFFDDLSDCRGSEQYDGLIEDLEVFGDKLGIDVTSLVHRVEEAKAEFESGEDAYADHMQDEWKERWREERQSERSLSDMFESLKDDRA